MHYLRSLGPDSLEAMRESGLYLDGGAAPDGLPWAQTVLG